MKIETTPGQWKGNPPKGQITPRTVVLETSFNGIKLQAIAWEVEGKKQALRVGYEELSEGFIRPCIIQIFLRDRIEAERFSELFMSRDARGRIAIGHLYELAITKCQLHKGSNGKYQKWLDIEEWPY